MTIQEARSLKPGTKLYRKGELIATFDREILGEGSIHRIARYILEWESGHTQLITDNPKGMTVYDYEQLTGFDLN